MSESALADILDSPINRTLFVEMTADQADAWLEQLRTTRLEPMQKLAKEATSKHKTLDSSQVQDAYSKQSKKVAKRFKEIEELITKTTTEINKLRTLQMELGI